MKPWQRAALRWSLAIGLVAIVVSRFDAGAVVARIGAANLVVAIPAIAGLVAVQLIGALAWRRLLARFAGIDAGWRSSVRLYYAAQAVGSVTPGNLGADIYRIAAVDPGSSRKAAAVPILLQRLTSTAALVLLAGIGALSLRAGNAVAAVPWVAVAALGAVAAFLIVVRLQPGILSALPHSRADLVALMRDGFGLGLAFHAVSIWLGWALIAAVDPATATHVVEVLAILAIARLSVVLPISPAGLGVQEAAVGVLFAQVGLEPGVALAAILLNRVALLVVVLLGTLGLVRGGRTRTDGPASSAAPTTAAITAATPRRPLALAAWGRARRH
jgi:uncharacterized membrane protein YbhN (UPF0104 family)